jgi:hypothetical protein
MLNDHDMRTFNQTAKAVLKHNKYMRGYKLDSLLFLMECDARRLMQDARDQGTNGYMSTRGYVLSAYTDYAGKLGVYASVSASLFDKD